VREREREREKKLTRMETMEEVTVGKRHINMAEGKFWLAVLCFYYLYILIGWCLAVQYCPNREMLGYTLRSHCDPTVLTWTKKIMIKKFTTFSLSLSAIFQNKTKN
jgi:hypothetical protein